MAPADLQIPTALERTARAEGGVSESWLDDLPALVATLLDEWSLTWVGSLEGGTASYAADVTRADGSRAVMKLAMPDVTLAIPFAHELRVLELADGHGCARVFEHDEARGAAVLERLGPKLFDSGLSVAEQIAVLCDCFDALWSAPTDASLPSTTERATWHAEFIPGVWEELGRPCQREVAELGIAVAEALAADPPVTRPVLVHGDGHAWNALVDPLVDGGYRFVDPDGLVGEAEYDLSIVMREFTDELVAGDAVEIGLARAAALAQRTGCDADRIFRWGFVERVSTGLLCRKHHMDEAQAFLDIGAAWASALS